MTPTAMRLPPDSHRTPTTPDTLVVSEVFGPTFQGEGPHLGQRAAFIRLGGCNLACSWCDTPYTWDATRYNLREELTRTPVDALLDAITSMRVRRVVVSGGEPLLWQDKVGWAELLGGLTRTGHRVEVETNGTLEPSSISRAYVDTFNVSPKLAHSGDPAHRRIHPRVLRRFAVMAHHHQAVMKVVVRSSGDVSSTRQLADSVKFPLWAVYVMPEGTTTQALTGCTEIAEAALKQGVNMTTRLHVLVWGEERGR